MKSTSTSALVGAPTRYIELYLTATFTGLRLGELLGLRSEDVDFKADAIRPRRNWTAGKEGTPKSGRGRAVPMMDEVAQALARLGQRKRFTGDQDLVFCDPLGRHLGYKSVSERYKGALAAAGLRRLRFHDLRHTFGTHAIRVADPREVMEWMGHADIQTTQKYLAYKPRKGAAKRLAGAFRDEVRTSSTSRRGDRLANRTLFKSGSPSPAASRRPARRVGACGSSRRPLAALGLSPAARPDGLRFARGLAPVPASSTNGPQSFGARRKGIQ